MADGEWASNGAGVIQLGSGLTDSDRQGISTKGRLVDLATQLERATGRLSVHDVGMASQITNVARGQRWWCSGRCSSGILKATRLAVRGTVTGWHRGAVVAGGIVVSADRRKQQLGPPDAVARVVSPGQQ
ncbi:hypothetical protein NL676_014570 [Syzygium grande]|nr:hypothetical protein NL676_014570 [Syzygium grande]